QALPSTRERIEVFLCARCHGRREAAHREGAARSLRVKCGTLPSAVERLPGKAVEAHNLRDTLVLCESYDSLQKSVSVRAAGPLEVGRYTPWRSRSVSLELVCITTTRHLR